MCGPRSLENHLEPCDFLLRPRITSQFLLTRTAVDGRGLLRLLNPKRVCVC